MAPPVNENDSDLSTEISVPPRFFSVEFHARFFPSVLGSRLSGLAGLAAVILGAASVIVLLAAEGHEESMGTWTA